MIVEYNLYKIFENVDDKISEYKLYQIILLNNNLVISKNTDLEIIKNEFDKISEKDVDYDSINKYDQPVFELIEIVYKLKFISDDDMVEYPIEMYYDDKSVYEIIDEDSNVLDTISFRSSYNIELNNESVKDEFFKNLLHESEKEFIKKYENIIHYSESVGSRALGFSKYFILLQNKNDGNFIDISNGKLYNVEKYYSNVVSHIDRNGEAIEKELANRRIKYDFNEDETNIIQVRFSNHSQNVLNVSDDIYKSISIVICRENSTSDKFKHTIAHKHYEYIFDEKAEVSYNNEIEVSDIMYEIDDFIY